MSVRGRRSSPSYRGGFTRRVPGLVTLALLNLTLPNATALWAGAVDEETYKTVVQRARSCVLKVECVDRAGLAEPTVLSAVALDDDGYVVTVGLRAPNNRTISVRDCSGKRYEADWIASDEYSGLALLKLEPGVAHPPAMTASLPDIGSAVFVVGNPFGLSHSVSVGVVSGLDRTVSLSGGVGRGLIQFTAPVFPGDSGGLLADHDGRMLGIVSMALNDPRADASSERRISGIGFAIPAPELRRIAQRLRNGQKVERGYLGLTAEDVEQGGVRVISVLRDSPAQQAGVREGDFIEAMDDSVIKDFDDLAGRVERLRPGTQITLRGKRGEDPLTVQATLGERSVLPRRASPPPWPGMNDDSRAIPGNLWDIDVLRRAGSRFDADGTTLGVHTQPITGSLAKSLGLSNNEGALINSVVPGSPADGAGLRASDVIVNLNDEPVQSPQQLHEKIRKLDPTSTVRVDFVRDGKTKRAEITLAPSAAGRGIGESMRWLGVMPWSPESQRARLDALEDRVRALEAKLDELQTRLETKAAVPAPSKN